MAWNVSKASDLAYVCTGVSCTRDWANRCARGGKVASQIRGSFHGSLGLAKKYKIGKQDIVGWWDEDEHTCYEPTLQKSSS